MDALHRLSAMVVADLRRRTREPRFWWLCAMLVVGAWFCLPAAGDNAGMRVTVGDARAFYSSAWIGMTLALCGSMLITLVGFYAVRGSIAHDIDSRSIELLMATPMTRAGYLLARFLGMLAVFGLFLVAMTLTGAVGQYVRGEVGEFRPFELVQPLLLITLPALAIAAAFAVWFDLVRGLRSTLGNVLYFFVWLGLLVAGALAGEASDPNGAAPGFAAVTIDVPGLSVLRTDIQPVLAEQRPDLASDQFTIGGNGTDDPRARFTWDTWSPSALWWSSRLALLALAFGAVLAAAPWLDAAAARPRQRHDATTQPGFRLHALDPLLRPLHALPGGRLVAAELRLALRPRGAWWWIFAFGALVAQAAAPPEARLVAWLLALGLTLPYVAHAIVRDREAGTQDLIAAGIDIPLRLVIARLGAGLLLGLAMSTPSLLRAPLAVSACFASVVANGFALARLTGNARSGELLFVLSAYLALNGVAVFQASSAPTSTAIGHGMAALLAVIVVLLPAGRFGFR